MAANSAETSANAGPRIVVLDGLRGLMTLFVIVSHYFGEVVHGVAAFAVGWIAVKMFFALSGFLVGRLILERADAANFFTVFYVRRFCRTIPVYAFCVLIVHAVITLLGGRDWLDLGANFPLWSYLTFTQNFFMISTGDVGVHWLAPTWTLTVEEQFYLVAPSLFFILPRRWLLGAFALIALSSFGFRVLVFQGGYASSMTALALLPGNADALCAGMFAAVLLKTSTIDWRRRLIAVRILPIVTLVATFLLKLADDQLGCAWTQSLGFLLISIGSAAFILSLALGAPEARRFNSRFLCFFGNTSYSIYLTHLAVLGLMHGLILGTRPDIANISQIAVTIAALPIAVAVGWIFTRLVEEPITAYGRSWRWSEARRPMPAREALEVA